jgi:SAM-dependent methyltransferase
MTTQADYWNHNVHYQPVILGAVPDGCRAALEVGCGDGLLARRLAARVAEVTAIDADARMVALARERSSGSRVRFVHGDFLACPIEAGSFDFACVNTSLHHMDLAAALRAMARALRPGGGLVVVGLAANRSLADYLVDVLGIPARRGRLGAVRHAPPRPLLPRRRRTPPPRPRPPHRRGGRPPGTKSAALRVQTSGAGQFPPPAPGKLTAAGHAPAADPPAARSATCRRSWATPTRAPRAATTAPASSPTARPATS